jgi:mono/diheme cytochrome c family protein
MSLRMKHSPVVALLLTALGASAALHAGEAPDGKALFKERCGMCHQTIGMGVSLLARRPGDTSKGFLEDRKDLASIVVRTVVRTGIGNMPRIARGEVSDKELTAIANYLSQGRP